MGVLPELYGDDPHFVKKEGTGIAAPADRPLRADARRNYDAIIRVAGEVFGERGTQASLDDIASRAGVGNATLYRHFPTRDALLVATLRYRLAELDRIAGTLGESEDAGAALEEWFFHVATHLRTWRGLPDCIAEALSDHGSPLNTACQPLQMATERLLSRAELAGYTRETLDPHDVFTLVASLAWAADKRTDTDDDLRRMIRMVLGGLERPRA